jgi:predicted transposase YbfD/YdcC
LKGNEKAGTLKVERRTGMDNQISGGLIEHFGDMPDPRIDRTKRHKLVDIIVIAICAVICGADDWVEVALFGEAKEAWFRTFLELPNGIPSHDTFNRVFARLDPDAFRARFLSWIEAICSITGGQVIAIDGKKLRGSQDQRLGKGAIDMVSAWATENQLVLGQIKVDDKSNEITAIPELLKLLAISGCLVTIDAMGCQKEIAKTIIEQEADYLLEVKENQGHLYEDIADVYAGAAEAGFRDVPYSYHKTVDVQHDRTEIRECWVISDPEYLHYLRGYADWAQLNSILMIRNQRKLDGKHEQETHYYIASPIWQADRFLQSKRSHWGIENRLHWVLDMAFQEDHHQLRKDHGPENFAVLRHIALNLLKQEHSIRAGIKAKRLRAGWDNDYLLKVLTQ